MGYYVNLEYSSVILKNENLKEILTRWKNLNSPEHDDIKYGGTYQGGKKIKSHYSWLPEDYDKEVNSVQDMLDLLGFSFEEVEQGIKIIGYNRKMGQEDVFFNAIADMIDSNQVMRWSGEDGDIFAWTFQGKTLNALNEMEYDKVIVREEIKKYNVSEIEAKKEVKENLNESVFDAKKNSLRKLL